MSFFHHHHDQNPPANPPPPHPAPFDGEMIRNPTVRIYTKAEDNYSLSVRNGAVVLAPANPRDEFQHWFKDFRWGTQVKDEEGLPAFALVNKATGLAIKHSLGPTHPVRLIPFNPDYLDESILWTESHDIGKGFRCIRMVNNIRLNFDAFNGDKDHGGVHDGTTIVLWEWVKGKNQSWKIVPYYCEFPLLLLPYHFKHLFILLNCKTSSFNLMASEFSLQRGKTMDSAISDLELNIRIRFPECAGFSCYFLHFGRSCVL